MSVQTIWTQDRDRAHPFNKETDVLVVSPVVHNDVIYIGFNLHLGSWLLGTFDSASLAAKEAEKIVNCVDDMYFVSGYSEYDIDDALSEMD